MKTKRSSPLTTKKPSPLMKTRPNSTMPETSTSNNKKMPKNTGYSIQLREQYSETHKKNMKTELLVISSSHKTTSCSSNDSDGSNGYESSASTPKVKRKHVTKRTTATERKETKRKFTTTVGHTSAPPKMQHKTYWDGIMGENQYTSIRRNLLFNPEEEDDNDFFLNLHPSTVLGYEGHDDGFVIPEWMPMTFRPTPKMSLNHICAYTAAYIFMQDDAKKHGDEVLVKTTCGVFGDRKALKSLMPRCPLDQEIINLVVARKNWLLSSLENQKNVWYLPTQFAQYALNTLQTPEHVRNIYQVKFMSTNSVTKIFIPVNDQGNHWYLLVVDFLERKLVWLDPMPCEERFHARRHSIIKLAVFLEAILLHESFTQFNFQFAKNLITNFSIVQPRGLPQQRTGSNDCGVWISKWMIECPFTNEYDIVNVVTATRMKLALYICQSSNNTLLNELVSKATIHWDIEQKKRKVLVKV